MNVSRGNDTESADLRPPVAIWTWSPIFLAVACRALINNTPPSALHCFLVIISILGALTNGTALLRFLKERALRSSFNIYIIHLLLLNFVFYTAQYSLTVVEALTPGRWLLSDRVCDFYLFMQSMFNAATANMHGLMAATRAWAILHPLSYREWNSERFSLQVSAGMWVYLVLVELPYWAMNALWYRSRGLTTTRTCLFNSLTSQVYSTATNLLIFTLPVLLVPVSFVTVVVAKVVRAHRRPSCPPTNAIAVANLSGGSAAARPNRSNKFLLLTLLTVSVTVCSMPRTIYFLVRQIRPTFSVPIYLAVGNAQPAAHAVVDPILLSLAVDRFRTLPVPERPAHYVFTVVSMSETTGLGVLDYDVVFDSVRPFHMMVETADTVHQGEQFGVRCALFNYYHQEMEILLILHGSPDYRFVEVGPFGQTQSYTARTVGGTVHHTVWLEGQATTVVYIPVVPTRLGDITLTITAVTQIEETLQTRNVTVIPDGVKMTFHTSIPIDLTNKGTLLKLMDISVTEDPVVPRQIERMFVLGSPKATVSAAGDVFGPILEDAINSATTINLPHQGGEMSVFSFALNLYALDFLRRTNQLTDDATTKLFNTMNSFYQTILNYQEFNGPFHQFMNETVVPNSVWLTTLTVQVFEEARKLLQYSDWEDYMYIDPLITEQCIRWILQHQTAEGSFYEGLVAPYDRKMSYHTCQPRLEAGQGCNWLEGTNATMTAQVVISLKEIETSSGHLGSMTIPARTAAVRYLERVLDLLFDPYEVAIVTYALTVVDSHLKDAAFDKLDQMKRSFDSYIYWGKEQIEPPGFILRNNLPYMEAHLPNNYESTNIAATSYALMVYNLRQSFLTERSLRG
ncbi:putative CD109 antigen [Hypsibius exemplaris]|uniref:CD109 antigen n=1 Tax=Hypsibius exemplaris TaxID=2072580 RepID=A0A1W0WS38_HYPEX|nr:putative CD109 antigen [Hypsibius exemplaris]